MMKLIVTKIGFSVAMLLLITFVVFLLVHLQPGNPFVHMINPHTSPEMIEAMLRKVGCYDPLHLRYFKWLGRVFRGDLGFSIQYGSPVGALIMDRVGNTLLLSLSAMGLSLGLAIPLGIFSAVRSETWQDFFLTGLAFLGISLPTFFFGYVLIKVFSWDLKWLPVSGMANYRADLSGVAYFWDVAQHMVLPVVVLALANMAAFMRYTRSAMLWELKQDYLRTAMSKGLSKMESVWRHAFRNALLPLITLFCLQIPFLFSGALITESVFVWPGIGLLGYEAVQHRDYPLIMGLLLVNAVIVLFANTLADVLYGLADPRLRYQEEE